MRLLYFNAHQSLPDSEETVQHFKQKCNEYSNHVMPRLNSLMSYLQDCLDEINCNSKYVQYLKFKKSILKLQSEIPKHSLVSHKIDVEELQFKLSVLNKEIDMKKNEVFRLKNSNKELLEKSFLLQRQKDLKVAKAKHDYEALSNLMNYCQKKLNCKISIENDAVFKFEYTNSSKATFLKFQIIHDSLTLVETCPKFEVSDEIIKKFNETLDTQGLLALYHFVSLHSHL